MPFDLTKFFRSVMLVWLGNFPTKQMYPADFALLVFGLHSLVKSNRNLWGFAGVTLLGLGSVLVTELLVVSVRI